MIYANIRLFTSVPDIESGSIPIIKVIDEMYTAFPCHINMSIFSCFLDTSQRYVRLMDISASGNILPENHWKSVGKDIAGGS